MRIFHHFYLEDTETGLYSLFLQIVFVYDVHDLMLYSPIQFSVIPHNFAGSLGNHR